MPAFGAHYAAIHVLIIIDLWAERSSRCRCSGVVNLRNLRPPRDWGAPVGVRSALSCSMLCRQRAFGSRRVLSTLRAWASLRSFARPATRWVPPPAAFAPRGSHARRRRGKRYKKTETARTVQHKGKTCPSCGPRTSPHGLPRRASPTRHRIDTMLFHGAAMPNWDFGYPMFIGGPDPGPPQTSPWTARPLAAPSAEPTARDGT